MGSQTFPAFVAIGAAALLSILLFVPFVAVQYRRHGRLTLFQALLWFGFLVYALALWAYTLLPLPDPAEISCAAPQLTPFQFVRDVFDYPAGSPAELLRNPAVMQVALNVLLFVPLGFFLRILWRRGVVVTTLTGLAISLAIETTQLTGVWGLYPCAYRLFDVDDLLANGVGALVGGLLSLALVPFLRDSATTASASAGQPRPVTIRRRLVGALCDALAFWLVGAASAIAVNLWRLLIEKADQATYDQTPATLTGVLVPLVLFGVMTLITGSTPGDAAVLLRWEGGPIPAPLARLLRYLGGIGGWQLLVSFASPFDVLFVLVWVIVLFAARRRGGLPGLVSGTRPVDARAPRDTLER